jgi:hypothetical protein
MKFMHKSLMLFLLWSSSEAFLDTNIPKSTQRTSALVTGVTPHHHHHTIYIPTSSHTDGVSNTNSHALLQKQAVWHDEHILALFLLHTKHRFLTNMLYPVNCRCALNAISQNGFWSSWSLLRHTKK